MKIGDFVFLQDDVGDWRVGKITKKNGSTLTILVRYITDPASLGDLQRTEKLLERQVEDVKSIQT